jgi:hypothetical protein
MSSLPAVALAFAKECLQQANSEFIEGRLGDADRVQLLPNGFSLGSMDASSLKFYDLTSVMQIVTFWCSQNGLRLTLAFGEEFDGGAYSCTVSKEDDEGKVEWLIEGPRPDQCYEDLSPCADGCYVLLAASVEAGRLLKRELYFLPPPRDANCSGTPANQRGVSPCR